MAATYIDNINSHDSSSGVIIISSRILKSHEWSVPSRKDEGGLSHPSHRKVVLRGGRHTPFAPDISHRGKGAWWGLWGARPSRSLAFLLFLSESEETAPFGVVLLALA